MIKVIQTGMIALGFFTILSAQQPTDVLMTVGNTPVTVEEFTYIYEKNNGEEADYSKESVEEYLNLYTKFKLKVAKARDMQLDTLPDLSAELDMYRRQLANSYLMDKEVLEKLLKEAFERRKQDVEVAHILVGIPRGTGQTGETQALQKIIRAKEEIDNGLLSFEEAAVKYSTDTNTAKNDGNMGYLTATLPDGFEDLENLMYEAELGTVNGPIKTNLGYHLIKITNRRPARGVTEVAHILIRKKKGNNIVPDAEERAMEAYNELLLGKDWDTVVKQYSEDEDTKRKKGNIGKVGIGMYAKPFEDAVFSLQKDGDFSMPVETSSGFHIIRRVYKEDLNDYAAYRQRMKDKMERKNRYDAAKEALIESIKTKHNYQVNEANLKHFAGTLDETFYTFKWQPAETEEMELFNMGDRTYMLEYFTQYLMDKVRDRQRFSKSTPPGEAVNTMLKSYSDEEAILYEETLLEASYPDFRNLMREYREGILLFEASKMNVWDKASQDTSGLKTFYNNNKSRYQHAPTARVINYVVKSTEEKKIKKVLKHAKKKDPEKTMKKFNKKDEFFVKTFDGEVAQDKNNLKGLEWKVGGLSDPVINSSEGKTTFSKVVSIQPGTQKTLKEARGYVIADYQDYLEKVWVRDLENTYPVDLNKKVLKQLIKK